jgi:hypothetical protein
MIHVNHGQADFQEGVRDVHIPILFGEGGQVAADGFGIQCQCPDHRSSQHGCRDQKYKLSEIGATGNPLNPGIKSHNEGSTMRRRDSVGSE